MVRDGQLLAVFNSAHRVMKAESILKSRSLPVLLIPAPRALSADCGLAIRYNEDVGDDVMKALSEEKLLPAFICRRITGNKYETIWNEDGGTPSN
ncbi:MAG: DUF3343 domain-containing protein [Steroidobacteraceae bacterium]|nr:DUF3343 domain-containing protein [Deltaproteobacteria bacterium]